MEVKTEASDTPSSSTASKKRKNDSWAKQKKRSKFSGESDGEYSEEGEDDYIPKVSLIYCNFG